MLYPFAPSCIRHNFTPVIVMLPISCIHIYIPGLTCTHTHMHLSTSKYTPTPTCTYTYTHTNTHRFAVIIFLNSHICGWHIITPTTPPTTPPSMHPSPPFPKHDKSVFLWMAVVNIFNLWYTISTPSHCFL